MIVKNKEQLKTVMRGEQYSYTEYMKVRKIAKLFKSKNIKIVLRQTQNSV
jgi:hypothetical protein